MVINLPGESQWREEKHHEEQEEVEFTHDAQLLTGPETQTQVDQINSYRLKTFRFIVCRPLPAPMGLSYSRIVNNGGQQSREGPQHEGGEELADEGALQARVKGR